MRIEILTLALVFAVALAHLKVNVDDFDNSAPAVTPERLEELRKVAPFEVYTYDEHPFKNMSQGQIRSLLGTHVQITNKKIPRGDLTGLPDNFDSREKWSHCMRPVRKQGHCGSCWAFAATSVLSDRFCISTRGGTHVNLSPQDLVSCDYLNYGCQGGYLDRSWFTLQWKGVVSETCLPYTSGVDGVEPSCQWFFFKCEDKTPTIKYYAKNSYRFTSIQQIKANLVEKGPVETGFLVYSDFKDYKSGIYRQTSTEFLGGHAVKVVGYGVENGVNYWVAQNSWGPEWGEEGFFRIKENECQFEAEMIAGDPYY